jgi:hypothetical protein
MLDVHAVKQKRWSKVSQDSQMFQEPSHPVAGFILA